MFPALFVDPAAGATTRKPDIADVIPGHVAGPFINREYIYLSPDCRLLSRHGTGCN